VSYRDWANVYPEGSETLDGVLVHRLPVSRPRDGAIFDRLHARVPFGRHIPAPFLQREWMRLQGPELPGLAPWLRERTATFDRVVFFTYLYYTAWAGIPAAAGLAPTVLHPTAHDEPPLYLNLFDLTFRLPAGLAFLTQEEADLVERRFHPRAPATVTGLGVDLDATGDAPAFRRASGVGDRPYLVYVGRVDPGKGSIELFDFFTAYKARHPSDLALVVVGEPVEAPPPHPDVFVTGFVPEATKHAAVAGAVALVQPSYFESFSLVLCEAWAQSKPALVQGHCAVLEGHARRSGGAIPYRGFAEFEAALDALLADSELANAMGRSGRRYVAQTYSWERVMTRYEQFLAGLGPLRSEKWTKKSPAVRG
jgi:glycosyltransferase involved in cell wall biosynthesis